MDVIVAIVCEAAIQGKFLDLYRGSVGLLVLQAASRRPDPEHGHFAGLERRIGGHQRQPFDSGLGHKNAIERIAMVRRQRRFGERVRMREGEPLEPAQPHAFGYVERRGLT